MPFTIYKFRTMHLGAERRKSELLGCSYQDGPAFKMAHDPRLTPLGRFLRLTSIDELPQLWNVLLGDMSLVGPRPLPCEEAAQCSPWQQWRHDVPPGLTCTWQVNGRSRVSFVQWMRMDRRYIRDRSLGKDLSILAATVPAILSCRGAH
jgi:lipopolysaccharide/colanic/teichoic acid biosynthesis glycosyltransferase